MTDKAAHPGVKSLLARFESSQQSAPSPPPRDRSPAGSDNMSKVRANFVAVDNGSQSSPIIGLRRISPHSEAPSSPSRMKSFSSEDLDGSVKSYGSAPQPTNGFAGVPEKKDNIPEIIETDTKGKGKAEDAASANKENQPAPRSPTEAPGLLPVKPIKTVSKRPSNVHVGKAVSASKPAPQAGKTATQPRTSTVSKPDSEKPARAPRVSRPPTTTSRSDPPKAPVHKPTRPPVATAAKTTRPPRSSTPARETTSSMPRTNNVRSSSTARSARISASATNHSQAPAAKLGATSTLSRKPSSLKGTTTAPRQRAITPTAATVRKQASRTPPGRSGSRPGSRASTATRSVDEGFLARMMRPTASSANKTHDKVEVKSPPRSNASHAPKRVPSKSETRSARPMKEKIPTETLTKKAAGLADTQSKGKEQEDVPAQVDVPEQSIPEVLEPPTQASEPIVDEKHEESTLEAPVESVAEPVAEPVVEPVVEPAGSHDDKSADSHDAQAEETAETAINPEPTTSLETERVEPTEHVSEVADEQVSSPTEPVVNETIEPAATETDVAEPAETAAVIEAVEPSQFEPAPAVSSDEEIENTTAVPLETDFKKDEVDIDINKLTLNDKESSS